MTARRHIADDERRARVGIRHRLAAGTQAGSLAEAAASLVVLHASDAASVFLQARARMRHSSPADIEHELYEERSVLRLLAMRRTLFLVPLADVPLVHAAASRTIAEIERRRTIKMFIAAGIAADAAAAAVLLEELEAVGMGAVRERGEATTAEFRVLDPRFGLRMTHSRGKAYEGTASVSTRVFFHLALDGRIGRGRPRGSWTSSQYRWSPIERWLPDGIADLPVDVAQAELARRWLRRFGPGTRDDLAWWTGWTVRATTRALATVGAVDVGLDGGDSGYVLPDDLDRTEPPQPWVALLPALDASTMGWADRDWYLGPYRRVLFDSSGNAGPTIWVDGRIVGGWAQRETGEIALRLLEDVGAETRHRIDAEATRLQAWIGPARVRTSFPPPPEDSVVPR